VFAAASWGDHRAAAGRLVAGSAWVYALSIAVCCTAWTCLGSAGCAAAAGVWFFPICPGSMLAMLLGWMVVRQMIRIAKTYRITSIADPLASRDGERPPLAGLVALIPVLGMVPCIALQLKAVASGCAVLTLPLGPPARIANDRWHDSTLFVVLFLACSTLGFGARHLDSSERHEGLVAAIAFESVVKLLAFVAVGTFASFLLFSSPAAIFEQTRSVASLRELLSFKQGQPFACVQCAGTTALAFFAVLFLSRLFQVMVVKNVDQRRLMCAVWLFALPIAFASLLYFCLGHTEPENFVLSLSLSLLLLLLLSLPLAEGHTLLALVAFVGGLSAATGMVIAEPQMCPPWSATT
jgi:Na+/proline symporter